MSEFTFFWHDYETFGRVPRRDRPAQFAGVRTDAQLNEIGAPLMLYCQPTPDCLPDPEACLLTGITPQLCRLRGVPEHAFADAVEAALAQPGTVGWQYSISGAPISFSWASVRTPANWAGRSRRGTRPKVS